LHGDESDESDALISFPSILVNLEVQFDVVLHSIDELFWKKEREKKMRQKEKKTKKRRKKGKKRKNRKKKSIP